MFLAIGAKSRKSYSINHFTLQPITQHQSYTTQKVQVATITWGR